MWSWKSQSHRSREENGGYQEREWLGEEVDQSTHSDRHAIHTSKEFTSKIHKSKRKSTNQ
jgi:hypothetical protein